MKPDDQRAFRLPLVISGENYPLDVYPTTRIRQVIQAGLKLRPTPTSNWRQWEIGNGDGTPFAPAARLGDVYGAGYVFMNMTAGVSG